MRMLAVVLLLLSCRAFAREWQVPADVPSIAAAVDSASFGDVVVVACGTYNEHDISLKDGVSLRGASDSADCATIDAGGLGRVLDLDGIGAEATVAHLTLTGGAADGGGLVRCRGGSRARFEHCGFAGGQSFSGGGGVECSGAADAVFVDCAFSANTAEYGNGGGLAAYGASPSLIRCAFQDNACGGEGGGLYISEGTLVVADCAFQGNDSRSYGGGLASLDCGGQITGCVFAANTARNAAGGAHVTWGAVTITNCAFTGNVAETLHGGGLKVQGYDVVTVRDCTITGNSAPTGAGLHCGCDVELAGTAITGNVASGPAGGLAMFGGLRLGAEDSVIKDNSGAYPADAFIPDNSTAYLRCCEFSPLLWYDMTVVTVDDSDCNVDVESSSWGGLKALWR